MSAGGGRGPFLRGNTIGATLRAVTPGLTSKGFGKADRAWNQAVNAPR